MVLGARPHQPEVAAGLEGAGSVVKKLGQPVPLSNFMSLENSAVPQPAQTNVPLRCSSFSGLVPARSVPSWAQHAPRLVAELGTPLVVGLVDPGHVGPSESHRA
jgi:hypothetical protein